MHKKIQTDKVHPQGLRTQYLTSRLQIKKKQHGQIICCDQSTESGSSASPSIGICPQTLTHPPHISILTLSQHHTGVG